MKTSKPFEEKFFDRLRTDEQFLAYYLHHFMLAEEINLNQLAERLKISRQDAFRLGSCIAPLPKEDKFRQRMQKIADFVGAEVDDLVRIVKTVYIRNVFLNSDHDQSQTSGLQAARKKEDEE